MPERGTLFCLVAILRWGIKEKVEGHNDGNANRGEGRTVIRAAPLDVNGLTCRSISSAARIAERVRAALKPGRLGEEVLILPALMLLQCSLIWQHISQLNLPLFIHGEPSRHYLS